MAIQSITNRSWPVHLVAILALLNVASPFAKASQPTSTWTTGRDQIIVQTDLADKSAALNPTLPKANTIVAALRGKTPESGGRRPGVGTVDAR